ncbi:SAM-dependent methyltransferase [Nocardia sp. Root136]|uniref:SAM-dependent methyltransferase n=1 Tax=Nocardia sp. Root136 TaxID=1736458 RepID=UPI0006FCDECA|nr:class I SAM-dependent methyltransferase [Nocardia sp. Root136]KQY29163.1 SAM-dependent methyltransferase [Nocardia sp. Root136]
MKLSTLTKAHAAGSLPLLLSLARSFATPLYRASFLVAALDQGVLQELSGAPRDLDAIADAIGIVGDRRLLGAWLDLGVRLGELGISEGRYRLSSRRAKALARPRNDAVAAALEELVRFHLPVLLNGPAMVRSGARLTMSDQDGSIIARSSRIVQPFLEEAVEGVLAPTGPVRLLEIGCGSGVYVRHAASLNPGLTAVAIDYQAEVAAEAAANLALWGLADRVEVKCSDVREFASSELFDIVTMHNNIYYFAVEERTKLLECVRLLLKPGGRLLLTTACRGGNLSTEVLGLWFEFADFGGPLPAATELAQQLTAAGFADVEVRRLIPGEQFCSFAGRNPSSQTDTEELLS